MTSAVIALLSVPALLCVPLLALAARSWFNATRLMYVACLAVCAVVLAVALAYLFTAGAAPATLRLPLGLPWIGVHIRLDALSAFFLVVANLGGAAASLFAIGHGKHEQAPGRVLPFYGAFIAGMNLVILADDAYTFLAAWEFMSLSSWALVVAHHKDEENRRAGFIYITMASFGTLCLLLAFGLLAGGGYTFDEIRRSAAALPGLVLILVLLGAGSKAGLVPLHVWLPLAHPAAPSHVSALMSGVMTKVAIYGFIRIIFDLIGPPAWWWGIVVISIAGVTCVLGVLSALMQHDLKRLLAYHTVENIGIIFIGLGLALAFSSHHMAAPAALAITAALFHVLNHSLFKSLLFFGAGAVLSATGQRDMERLGGLMRNMPITAFTFLTGCMAISALPPLNGFVSEWLTFQAILLSPDVPSWGIKIIVPAVGAMLALSAALAAACFVKAFGVTFLGRARTPAAQEAREVDRASLAAMGVFAALCLLAGILPGLIIDWMAPVVEQLVNGRMPRQAANAWLSIVPVAESRSSYNGLLIFAFITLATLATVEIIHRFASRTLRRGAAWDCGFPDQSAATQYTADSFAQPIRRVFGEMVFQAREHVDMPAPGQLRPARMTVSMRDPVWDLAFAPTGTAIWIASEKLNYLQFLTIRQFLSLVFAALVGLLFVLMLVMLVWT
ncbi:MAG: hydrogenase 4 subunit B [Hyphomicrobiaceae bacterium]|nr:MAG: hydrogenase 4 subunit B [Hyphomicrobiaceae bacterium]